MTTTAVCHRTSPVPGLRRRQAVGLVVAAGVATGAASGLLTPRAVPAREWFDALGAPTKVWTEMPRAGHRPAVEQPERFAAVMRTVRDDTR